MSDADTQVPEPEPLEQEAAHVAVRAFMVAQPLYVPMTVVVYPGFTDRLFLPPPMLRRGCNMCGVETNWHREKASSWSFGAIGTLWKCVQCTKTLFRVWIDLVDTEGAPVPVEDDDHGPVLISSRRYTLTKVGQWEPWSIRPDPALMKEFEKADRDLYRKALMNMSAGYGLGALAYFRRVVENETARMLDVIAELAKDDGDEELLLELEKAKKGHNADERLRLAANATPASLKLGGVNPLKVIYAITSGGVHSGDEAECIEIATELRVAFEYVFRHVRDTTTQRAEFRRVLTKRRGKVKPDGT